MKVIELTAPRLGALRAAAMNGTVFVIGFLSGSAVTVEVVAIREKELTVKGNHAGPVAALREAAEAYAHLAEGGKHFGKIAVSVD